MNAPVLLPQLETGILWCVGECFTRKLQGALVIGAFECLERPDRALAVEKKDPVLRQVCCSRVRALDDVFNSVGSHPSLEWVRRRRRAIRPNFISEMKNIHQSSLPLAPPSSLNGFSSERLAGVGPRAVRIMSMTARSAAGTCRCPGVKR